MGEVNHKLDLECFLEENKLPFEDYIIKVQAVKVRPHTDWVGELQ